MFLVVSTTNSTVKATNETFEWKVKVGDSRTYTLSKYIDLEDSDGNGDTESETLSIQDEDGEMVNVTLRKDTKYTVEITALNGDATTQTTYGNIVAKETTPYYNKVVWKTIDNKTYWEEYVKMYSSALGNVTIEGNPTIIESDLDGPYGTTAESKRIWDWKTGWITYLYSKISNDTHTIFEQEITSGSSGIGGFEITTIFVGLTIIAIVVSRKKQNMKE